MNRLDETAQYQFDEGSPIASVEDQQQPAIQEG
jgi:hypothetical protein